MKSQFKWALLIFLSFSSLLFAKSIMAHAEHDKARFIANSGVDKGLCDNPLRPCKTILYGVSRAAKGDRLLLAAGEYDIASLEQLLALKSALVPILGGYNRFDHFNNQSPSTNITYLRGIPNDLVELVREHGFQVISDGKSHFSKGQMQRVSALYNLANQSQSGAECIDGKAAGYRCNNVDLVAHVSLQDFSFRPSAASDIWGHVDLNTGTEYAIIGIINGVAIFDLSDPQNPREVGSISGLNSSWRDIKVYQYFDPVLKVWQAYAYVTIDNASDYVSIIDLNRLPQSVSLVTKDTAVRQAHNVHITNVDYALNIPLLGATPSLQLIGTPSSGDYRGSFLSYSLADPKKLTALPTGGNYTVGYTHDGVSMRIDDQRKNIDCKTGGSTCTLFVDFNEKEINLWDVSKHGEERKLSTLRYNDVPSSAQYVHSGWWSEDKRYLFAHDEFDESTAGINTTLRIFDLQSLTNPSKVGQWTGPTSAIDHNGFVRGNRYYMSNYTRGMTVLDITDAPAPQEVGYFDTYNASDSASFNGAWGIYPFLPSGLILVSDISGGLFVLRDTTRDVEQGTFSFEQGSIAVGQGQTISIEVKRQGAVAGASDVSVGYEILPGSAEANIDYSDARGVLQWQGDDVNSKTLTIDVAADLSGEEAKEQFFVRLFNPTNNATISSPHYLTVNLTGQDNSGLISFAAASVTVNEQQGQLVIDVYRNGGISGSVSVDYSLTSASALVGEDVEHTAGTLVWDDGDRSVKQIILNIINDAIDESDESFVLALSAIGDSRLGSNHNLDIVINDDESNTAPQITMAENFEVNTSQTTSISASVSDAQDDALTYLWAQISGGNVTLRDSTTPSVKFSAPSIATTLSFTLTVTDSRGLASEASIEVTVVAPVVIDNKANKKSSGGVLSPFSLLLVSLLGIKWLSCRRRRAH